MWWLGGVTSIVANTYMRGGQRCRKKSPKSPKDVLLMGEWQKGRIPGSFCDTLCVAAPGNRRGKGLNARLTGELGLSRPFQLCSR